MLDCIAKASVPSSESVSVAADRVMPACSGANTRRDHLSPYMMQFSVARFRRETQLESHFRILVNERQARNNAVRWATRSHLFRSHPAFSLVVSRKPGMALTSAHPRQWIHHPRRTSSRCYLPSQASGRD